MQRPRFIRRAHEVQFRAHFLSDQVALDGGTGLVIPQQPRYKPRDAVALRRICRTFNHEMPA